MKPLHVLCLLGAFAFASGVDIPDELKEMAQMVHDQCIGETGASADAIEGTKKGVFPADDQKLKCYLKCIYSNMGAISDEGELDAEAFGSIMPEELGRVLNPMINKCKDTTGPDGCELAFNFNICLYNADPKNYLVI
ncbi:general odorant-binding protein 69a [Halyomorpha halys]|uniref:general odorant-binding protein 69a n=1 Tax=Halyomorpha halys TaxID=286706 RepID=UPI0006D507B3|nr:general odorant-binding protein 69a [Halyomorpha halys]KAE8573626.1 Odorant-binding protein 30 [Halyomorpha halys]